MRPVYPRWRGEHKTKLLHKFHSRGLSPLARGTHARTGSRTTNCRFIPAGAGNTLLPAQNRRFASVYPRWRGEHSASVQAGTRYSGLSPLARGTRGFFISAPRSARFIPAGAGNTYRSKLRFQKRAVYPRWRGEHFTPTQRRAALIGLSPLARGTH